MTRYSIAVALLCAFGFSSGSQAAELWTLDEYLMNPESAAYSGVRDVLYVSNIAGDPVAKDGNGFISLLGRDGDIYEEEWITGLNAPKGIGLTRDENTLYVADIDRLVQIDIAMGQISGSWDAEGAQFLNDLTVDDAGNVFVTDMLTNSIYLFSNGSFDLWLQDDALMHPNGIRIGDNQLIIAAWGAPINDDFTTVTPGHLIVVDFPTKEISALGSGAPIGNLDGIAPDGQGNWIVTDWMAGTLFRIDANGNAETLLDLDQGSADIDTHIVGGVLRVIIPMMNDNRVVTYSIE